MNKLWITIGCVVLVLSGAVLVLAFEILPGLETGMVKAQAQSDQGKEIVLAIDENINGEVFSGEVKLIFEDPPNLPDEPPQLSGLFLDAQGDKIILGTGSIEVEVVLEQLNNQDPVKKVKSSHSGKEVSFIVTEKTEYFKDITEKPEITAEIIAAGEVIVPGVLVPGVDKEIGTDTVLRVWGAYQNGDIVADLVVYDPVD